MKLGAAYNVFDGIELLQGSIRSIRKHVDFVCVVMQEVSNFGNDLDNKSIEILNNLIKSNLIDRWCNYGPYLNKSGAENEIFKRNIGLSICKENGCSHFLSLDADEYYLHAQFAKAKQAIIDNDYDTTACQMLTYYHDKDVIVWPPEQYYVPFIYKLDDRRFRQNTTWPVAADPTRKLEFRKGHLFERGKLQMHHFSYVRNNIRQKLENSSAMVNWKNRIPSIVNYFEKWEYPKPALFAGSKEKYLPVMKILPLF
jgi:hypothetical protein